MRDWVWTPAPEGECFADLVERVSAWLDDWSAGGGASGRTVVVAHAGSIRAILCRLLRLPLEDAFAFEVDCARITGLELDPEPRLVIRNAPAWPSWTGPFPETDRCPSCGSENECAVAAGEPVTACWCYGARLPRLALEKIPKECRNRVCICQRCAERAAR
jgi:hypothetical protein